jgi:hypothetical protein
VWCVPVDTTASMRSASYHTLPPAGAPTVLCRGPGLPGCTYHTQTQLQHIAVRCSSLLAVIPHLAIGEQDATCCCCYCCFCCCCQVAGRCLVSDLAAWVCYRHPLWACSMQPPAQRCILHRTLEFNVAPRSHVAIADSCRNRCCNSLHRSWTCRGGRRCGHAAKVSMLLDSTLEAMVRSVHTPLASVCALLQGNDDVLCHCS